MKTVDDLIQDLKVLQIRKNGHIVEVVEPDGFSIVENIIRGFLLDHHDSEIGEMQGKIFAYEEIIKKSNFAPFVKDNRFQEILLNMQKAIAKYETEKASENPFKEETEKETMFYSEFQKSDDWKYSNYVEYFDLSGNVVETPKDSDKILKYYKRELNSIVFLIVFIGKE